MPKSIIEPLPFKFDYNLYDVRENIQYLLKYKATNEDGKYLYWDKFRFHVNKDDNPKIAWWATKFNRFTNRKTLNLRDKKNDFFYFSIPDALQAKLYKIMQKANQGIVPHDSIKKQYLISSLIMEEAISSSQLEGAATTRKVAKDMIVSQRKPRSEDEWMILNNYLLLIEVKKAKNDNLSMGLIKEFHKIATQNTSHNKVIAGEFRNSDDIVITDGYDVIFEPPTFDEIDKRLQKLCYFANTNHHEDNPKEFIDPIVKAIILHFMIGYIHPFNDGNGRVARALFYWYMLKNGFDYFEYVSISSLLKNAPKQYALSYLYSENDDNDITYFISYQLDIMLRAIEELLKYLQAKSNDFEEALDIFKHSRYNDLFNFIQKDVVKKAIKEAGRVFTAKEIAIDYSISENSARKYLNELASHQLLFTSKKGKSIMYIATNDIRNRLAHK
ncbi:MAG: Fic family protein [Sulfurovaceae bacterium]|nr:Fic family protein [Sulfurovaceae bacterium]